MQPQRLADSSILQARGTSCLTPAFPLAEARLQLSLKISDTDDKAATVLIGFDGYAQQLGGHDVYKAVVHAMPLYFASTLH